MDPASLIAAFILGTIGVGYFIYGKKQASVSALVAGILLNILPLMISNLGVLYVSGVLLMAMPIAVHKYL